MGQSQSTDLGDYIGKHKHQKKKGDISKQKVSKNEEAFKQMEELKMNEQENSRTKRFVGAETPKTYNKTFGCLKDFLLFFTNRGPEIKNFAIKFQEIEDSQDLDRLNQEILPLLIDAFKKESANKKGKQVEEIKIINLFQMIFQSFKEFYGNILKAYTVEGFLYKNLNQYLRNEDWIQLDNLLPYGFCLFKAFLWSELTSAAANSTNPQKPQGDDGQNSKMTVYRGAQFDEISLNFYDPQTVSVFSWNAVTSTSSNRSIAEKFMKNISKDSKKIPVMFVIEVPISPNNLNGSTWIDIKPFSVFPTEDEIVLSPGSTFKLMNILRDNKGVEIQLDLVTEVSTLAYQGHIMHGAMHTEMTMSSVSRIVGLEGNELGEALYHLKGNGLIQELVLALCKFDSSTLAILIETLPTIPNLTKLLCVSIFTKDKTYWNVMLQSLRNQNIKGLEIDNQSAIDEESLISLAHGVKYLTCLTTLTLNFTQYEHITDEGLKNLCSQGIRYLTSLTALNLSFEHCSKITDEGLNNLFSQGIIHLASLTALNLNFAQCEQITDEWLSNLCSQGIKHLTSLTALNLDFTRCKITDEGLNNLCSQGIRHLTSLTALNLNFYGCREITDQGLNNLCSQGIRHLASLTALDLTFDHCYKITDEGLNNLCSQGIRHLDSLITLNLNFYMCREITDEGLNNLCSQGIRHLTSLTVLKLCFACCEQITDKGLNNLCSQGIRHLTSLTDLNLNFAQCEQITDEGLNNLCSQGIRHLTSLTALNLDFTRCKQITDKGLNNLCSQGIRHLTSLTALNLNFYGCREITDEGLNNLCSQGIRHLASLTALDLTFENCPKITDEGLNNLCSQGIRHLDSLTGLNLNFNLCRKITDEGLNRLKQQVNISRISFVLNKQKANDYDIRILRWERDIKNESSNDIKRNLATNLPNSGGVMTLNSRETVENFCSISTEVGQLKNITCLNLMGKLFGDEKELITFGSEKLRHLTSLTALNLSFKDCSEITDEGLNNLCSQGIRHLTSLTALNLDFTRCKQITDEGLNNLCSQGIRHLTSLTALNLNFEHCSKITDEGLNNLCSQGIRHLTSLTTLNLNFEHCSKITDEGLNNLCSQGIRHLALLTALDLNFDMCLEITDEGLNNLCSQGIRHLTLLTALKLCFSCCEQITDEGLINLCSQGIRRLTSLTSISLNFDDCPNISNTAVKNLAFLLTYFGFHPKILLF